MANRVDPRVITITSKASLSALHHSKLQEDPVSWSPKKTTTRNLQALWEVPSFSPAFRARLLPIIFPISAVFPSYQLDLCFLRTGAVSLSLVEFRSLAEAPCSRLRWDCPRIISHLYLSPAGQNQEPHSRDLEKRGCWPSTAPSDCSRGSCVLSRWLSGPQPSGCMAGTGLSIDWFMSHKPVLLKPY